MVVLHRPKSMLSLRQLLLYALPSDSGSVRLICLKADSVSNALAPLLVNYGPTHPAE